MYSKSHQTLSTRTICAWLRYLLCKDEIMIIYINVKIVFSFVKKKKSNKKIMTMCAARVRESQDKKTVPSVRWCWHEYWWWWWWSWWWFLFRASLSPSSTRDLDGFSRASLKIQRGAHVFFLFFPLSVCLCFWVSELTFDACIFERTDTLLVS